MRNRDIKEWYTKEEILEMYPIGITTYKKRIRKLNTPTLSGYTRMSSKTLVNSNLKTIKYREIHKSILNDLFVDRRIPSKSNITNIIKWVNNTTWDWIGNIVPCKTFPKELGDKLNYLYKQIKKHCNVTNPILFYSIEQNPNDNYFHSHFLIKDDSGKLNKKVLFEYLELICEPNTPTETRIYLKPYDYKNHGKDGSDYSIKESKYGYDILK